MSFQGHIENGAVVVDEPVSLPDGTIVRIEPVISEKKEPDPLPSVIADTDQPYSVPQMARAWKAIAKPIPEADARVAVDPDDYPLF